MKIRTKFVQGGFMAKKNFYAVTIGRNPGIYPTWKECKENTDKYPGAKYKGFKTKEEAIDYIEADKYLPSVKNKSKKILKTDTKGIPLAFVDGSFNTKTRVFGYGGFVEVDGTKHYINGSDDDKELASMQSVAGEIFGAIAAVKKAEELGLKQLIILYDYVGIEHWAVGDWKTNKEGTKFYKEFMNSPDRKIDIYFQKVKGHSGIEGNEIADMIARFSTGISTTQKEKALLAECLKEKYYA